MVVRQRLLLIAIAAVAAFPTSLASNVQIKDSIFRSLGYSIRQSEDVAPSDWEKEQFNLQTKRVRRIKAIKPVPGYTDTYHRFTITEEVYASESEALARLNRLMEKPPGMSAEENKAFPLRIGFQCRSTVYIVSTDAALFEYELNQLARKLREFCK